MKQLLGIAALSIFVVSCSVNEQVVERFNECVEMVQNEATERESLACWSRDSRAVISGVFQQQKNSASTLDYLRDYQQLLNHDEIESLEVYGDVALMQITKGRSSREIVLLREDGVWTINALELGSFWAPLDQVAGVR